MQFYCSIGISQTLLNLEEEGYCCYRCLNPKTQGFCEPVYVCMCAFLCMCGVIKPKALCILDGCSTSKLCPLLITQGF